MRAVGGEETHSQNSMTGEVAFGLVVWLIEAFALRNSMQFSEQGGREG